MPSMTQIARSFFSLGCLAALASTTPAAAQCREGGAGRAERALSQANIVSLRDFLLWLRPTYRTFEEDWQDWGYRQPGSVRRPYGKVVNAAMLIEYGPSDDESLQWHSRDDYHFAARGLASDTHDQIHYHPSESRDFVAQAEIRPLREDWTELGCKLFDRGNPNDHPAVRAGAMVHEGWHHWQAKYGQGFQHFEGPLDRCLAVGDACDYFYPHTVSEYPFGDLHKVSIVGQYGRLYHSAFQVQAEFLCDIAELSHSAIPESVRDRAKMEANVLLTGNFRNRPGHTCGEPRPW